MEFICYLLALFRCRHDHSLPVRSLLLTLEGAELDERVSDSIGRELEVGAFIKLEEQIGIFPIDAKVRFNIKLWLVLDDTMAVGRTMSLGTVGVKGAARVSQAASVLCTKRTSGKPRVLIVARLERMTRTGWSLGVQSSMGSDWAERATRLLHSAWTSIA